MRREAALPCGRAERSYAAGMQRLGLVIHPTRDIGAALSSVEEWAERNDIEVVQLEAGKHERDVAPAGEVDACDLVVAVGGDGTVLTALRGAAASAAPVLGVACGSLGALSAVSADEVADALEAFKAGDWKRWDIPALEIAVDGEQVAWALNDFVVVRRAGQQLTADISIGGELYAKVAGDGVIAATLLGSSAYSMGAGGPLLVSGTKAFVVTPIVIHGGSVPSAVIPSDLELEIEVHPGYGGFDVEIDGQTSELDGSCFTVTLAGSKSSLVGIGQPRLAFTALRRRGLIADSPRMLAREDRARLAERAAD
jgi:NAD+ kinase